MAERGFLAFNSEYNLPGGELQRQARDKNLFGDRGAPGAEIQLVEALRNSAEAGSSEGTMGPSGTKAS